MSIENTKPHEPVRFMIIDDDDISIMALERAIKKLKLVNPVEIANDGIEALEILRKAVDTDGSLPPYILTLDLNMPKMGGLEFLEIIRNDKVLKKLVVFVLTSSDASSDIAAAYEHGIAGYIVKEDPTDTFRDTLEMLNDYSQVVVLPT